MLHSTLPRAFLAPGLSYFAGYYGDQMHAYAPSYMALPPEDAYSRITEPHVLTPWEINSRTSTPCPLDLSLKPSVISRAEECESIEVDDEEDRRHREEDRRNRDEDRRSQEEELQRYRAVLDNEEELIVDDSPGSSGYDFKKDLMMTHKELLLSAKDPVTSQRDLLASRRDPDPEGRYLMETPHKYQHQKLLLSPSRLQTYQQQLLLTPQQQVHSPMTPPSTPSPPQCPRRRHREEDTASPCSTKQTIVPRKKKHARKLKFDEDTSSPVSGTVILGPDEAVVTGDIDPAFNIVEVTDEARAELAKIENRLGPYQCKLCRQLHDDAFQLAQHRCSRIAHVEYRCPECDKRFSCPANLASHRRWHKPRVPAGEVASSNSALTAPSVELSCTRCDAKFSRQAALRKHLVTQHPETVHNNNNTSSVNNNDTNGAEMVKPIVCSPLQIGGTSLPIEMP